MFNSCWESCSTIDCVLCNTLQCNLLAGYTKLCWWDVLSGNGQVKHLVLIMTDLEALLLVVQILITLPQFHLSCLLRKAVQRLEICTESSPFCFFVLPGALNQPSAQQLVIQCIFECCLLLKWFCALHISWYFVSFFSFAYMLLNYTCLAFVLLKYTLKIKFSVVKAFFSPVP